MKQLMAGGGVALPHPMGRMCPRTFVAVGLLDEPVLWDESGERAEAVFLFGFGEGDGERFEGLFGRLSAFLTDHDAVAALLGERVFDALARGLSTPRRQLP
jgi:mannitol/fructose-specific phosphotransferase system IIA component (Ntr-type)